MSAGAPSLLWHKPATVHSAAIAGAQRSILWTVENVAVLANGRQAIAGAGIVGRVAQMRAEPVYETIEGWEGTTGGARSWADLPAQAIKYVRRIEELIGAPVALLSTSPKREDTILVHDPFRD